MLRECLTYLCYVGNFIITLTYIAITSSGDARSPAAAIVALLLIASAGLGCIVGLNPSAVEKPSAMQKYLKLRREYMKMFHSYEHEDENESALDRTHEEMQEAWAMMTDSERNAVLLSEADYWKT